jgi:RNA polymerase sigma factor (sigma-70 family)
MKNVQVPTPQEQKAAKDAKEKQTSEAYPKQQAARYNPDGDTYKGSGNKMPTLDPNDPVHAADRYGIEHDEPYEQDFEKSELKDLIAKHLERLSKRQQIVLKLRFWHDLSLEDVGKHLGISPERVRQIEAKALRSLRTPTSKSDELRPYAEAKQQLDPKCWKGYKKQGTKMKGNTRVNNCVPVGESAEATMSKLIKLLESK